MTRIACVQTAPLLGEVKANFAATAAAIANAVAVGADIVVLPELATSGYLFADADEARRAARSPNDPAFGQWISAAGEAVVVGGFCELGADGALYNSALVIDGGATAAVYRKTHLWDREKLIFTPGDARPPVLRTPHGVIAVMICYDLEFAELTRQVALAGAELIAAPVNWPSSPHPDGERPGEMITAMSAARTNRVAIAICDRAGVERGQPWIEGTAIIGPDGWVAAAAGAGEGMAITDIDLSVTHDKSVSEYVDVFADRRPDLY